MLCEVRIGSSTRIITISISIPPFIWGEGGGVNKGVMRNYETTSHPYQTCIEFGTKPK
jgi:hypothetical protein